VTWFKISDTFHAHPKVMATRLDAVGLWAVAGAWCGANLTDGFVPDHVVARLTAGDSDLAKALVTAGLWRRTRGGFEFHDWNNYQPTRTEVENRRESWREAKRRQRRADGEPQRTRDHVSVGHSQDSDQMSRRDSRRSQALPSRPVPESPNGDSRGGGARPRAPARETAHPARSSARCVEHEHDADPPRCGACARAQRFTAGLLRDELDAARRDPRLRCEHGTDGGKHVRSDTHQPLCALCRAQQSQEAT